MKRFLILSSLLILLSTPGVRAQMKMSVEAGFEQNCRAGCWTPIAVELESFGDAAEGEIVMETHGLQGIRKSTFRYTTPFSLASGKSKKRFILYAQIRNMQQRIMISVMSGRRTLAKQEIPIHAADTQDQILLSISDTPGRLNFLAGMKVPAANLNSTSSQNPGKVQVWNSYPANLPDHWKGYDAVDVIAIGSIPASALTTAQQEALTAWVQSGGTLVISGGADWRRLRDPFYRNLLPVDVTGSMQTNSLGSLAAYCGSPSPTGALLIPAASPLPGAHVRAAQSGIPMLAERKVGMGEVVYLAPDCYQAPMIGWNGQMALWKPYLLHPAIQNTIISGLRDSALYSQGWQSPYGNGSVLADAVTNIPAMDTPSFGFIGLFLACYIIILVPVNYLVLKKRDKREYAWITIPVIVVIFSLAAYGIGYAIKGGRVLLNQAEIIETRAGCDHAAVVDYAGLFSPGRTTYEIGFKDPKAIAGEATSYQNQQTGDLTIETGDTMRVKDLNIDMWSMRVLSSESVVDLGGEFEGKARASAGRIIGTVSNNSDYSLESCTIICDGGMAPIGDLPSGTQDKRFTIKNFGSVGIDQPFAADTTSRKIADAIQSSLMSHTSVAQMIDPILVGWIRKPVIEADINRRYIKREAAGLVLVHLPSLGQKRVQIPWGSCDARVLGNPPSWYGPDKVRGGLSGVLRNGSMVVEFRLPASAQNTVCRQLNVRLGSKNGGSAMIQAWSWDQGQWVTQSSQGEASIPMPNQYVKNGLVRLRLTNRSNAGITIGDFDIAYTGR